MPFILLYNAIIDTSHITGIGPLLSVSPSNLEAQAYRQAQFRFELYTKGATIIISTDQLSFMEPMKQASKDVFNKINECWEQLRYNLLHQIDLDSGFQVYDVGNPEKPFNE